MVLEVQVKIIINETMDKIVLVQVGLVTEILLICTLGPSNRNQPASNYDDPWEYLSAGWNTVTTAASAATASVTEQLQNVCV